MAGVKLGQSRRRWAKIKPTLAPPLVFSGLSLIVTLTLDLLTPSSLNLPVSSSSTQVVDRVSETQLPIENSN